MIHIVKFTDAYSYDPIYIVLENITSMQPHKVNYDKWTEIISGADKRIVCGNFNTTLETIQKATDEWEISR